MSQLETRRYAAGFVHVRSTVDSPRHHARAGRTPVHKPEVGCGRPVLHVAPPSVGLEGASRCCVSVEISEHQWGTGAQTPCASRESVQEEGVFRPADVERHVDGHHGQPALFDGHEALSPLDYRARGVSRDSVPEYGDQAYQISGAPWRVENAGAGDPGVLKMAASRTCTSLRSL